MWHVQMANQNQVNLIHPLVSLEWEEYGNLPFGMQIVQAVYGNGNVYMGGVNTSPKFNANLVILSLSTYGGYQIIESPVKYFALALFNGQVLLIGGRECLGGKLTNVLHTIDELGQQIVQIDIPPMKTRRYDSSAIAEGVHLIIAGGVGESGTDVDIVEIYNDTSKQWSTAQPLPKACRGMKSTIHLNKWILMGGVGQAGHIYTANIRLLIQSSRQFSTQLLSVWESLTRNPFMLSSLAVLNKNLVSVGGAGIHSPSDIVLGYSTDTHTWIEIEGKMPTALKSTCTVVLPTGKLIVAGVGTDATSKIFKAGVKVSPFDIDGQFSLRDLNKVISIPLRIKEAVKMWISKVPKSRQTWRSFINFLELRFKKYQLAENIVKYMSMYSSLDLTSIEPQMASVMDQQPLQKSIKETIRITTAELEQAQAHLTGVEVCKEITVVVTNSHQHFHWEGHGLKLNIPDDCLPAHLEQCTIKIQASLAGQYEFPENSHLVSAVYWLRCEPSCKFTKLVSVEMQHCAQLKNVSKLSFVRSHCTQKQLPYIFKKLGHGFLTEYSSYGVVQLDRFSGLGVVGEGDQEIEYCGQLYYFDRETIHPRISFVVTWNTEVHLNATREFFGKDGGVLGPFSPVAFEEDRITLDVPLKGRVVNKVWRLTPLIPPIVTKSQVDSFVPGKMIPSCQLEARFKPGKHSSEIPDLFYQMRLLGARDPHNMFTITCTYQERSTSFTQDSAFRSPPADGVAIGLPSPKRPCPPPPTISELLQELLPGACSKWEYIGLLLQLNQGALDTVKADHRGDTTACLCEMLKLWVNRVDPPPTWSAIIDAIERIGNQQLAQDLRLKHPS